jgi:hypothetical protein
MKFAQTFYMLFVVFYLQQGKRKQGRVENHKTSLLHRITQSQLGKDQEVQPMKHSIYASARCQQYFKISRENYFLDRYLHFATL